jgi:hypothetical protein
MSNQKVVCVNELTIRIEQLENVNAVNWTIIPDKIGGLTKDISLMDLAEYGAPLSVLAAHTLLKMCSDGMMSTSLETAHSIMIGVAQRTVQAQAEADEDALEGVEVGDMTMQ